MMTVIYVRLVGLTYLVYTEVILLFIHVCSNMALCKYGLVLLLYLENVDCSCLCFVYIKRAGLTVSILQTFEKCPNSLSRL